MKTKYHAEIGIKVRPLGDVRQEDIDMIGYNFRVDLLSYLESKKKVLDSLGIEASIHLYVI